MAEPRVLDVAATCGKCKHVRALHSAEAGCRLGGCGCDGFWTPDLAQSVRVDEYAPAVRAFTFEIPPGFMATVVLTPYAGDPNDPLKPVPDGD